jgi:hypothetical protein
MYDFRFYQTCMGHVLGVGVGGPQNSSRYHISCFEILEKIRETCFVCGCFELGFL